MGFLSNSFAGGCIFAKSSRPGGRDLTVSKEVPSGLLGGGGGVFAVGIDRCIKLQVWLNNL